MAKKWAEVVGSEAFQSLPDSEKEAAREQYFNAVVAPRVPENDLGAVREQFFSTTTLGTPKTKVKAQPESSDSGFAVSDPMGSSLPEAIAAAPEPKKKSVLEGMQMPGPLPTEDKMLRPEFIDAVQAQLNATPADKREAALTLLQKRDDVYGRAAKVIAGRYSALDEAAKTQVPTMKRLDPRLEAQTERFIEQGMEPEAARNLARAQAESGEFRPDLQQMRRDVQGEIADQEAARQRKELEDAGFLGRVGAETKAQYTKAGLGLMNVFADLTGDKQMQSDIAGSRRMVEAGQRAIPKGESVFERSAQGAISSLAGQAPMIALSMVTGTPAPVLLQAGVQQFGDSYGEARAAGQSPEAAAARAIPMAAAEIFFERFGMEKAMAGLRKFVAEAAKRGEKVTGNEIAEYIGKSVAKEIPSEMATTVTQYGIDLVPGVGLNKNPSMADLYSQLEETLRQTIIQAGVQSGAIAAGTKGMEQISKALTPERTPYERDTSYEGRARLEAMARGFLTPEGQRKLPPETRQVSKPAAGATTTPPAKVPTGRLEELTAQGIEAGMPEDDARARAEAVVTAEETKKAQALAPRVEELTQEYIDAGFPPAEAKAQATAQAQEEAEADEIAQRDQAGAGSAQPPVAGTTPASVGVAGQSGTGAPAQGAGVTQPAGVVPSGQGASGVAGGKAAAPAAMTPERVQELKNDTDRLVMRGGITLDQAAAIKADLSNPDTQQRGLQKLEAGYEAQRKAAGEHPAVKLAREMAAKAEAERAGAVDLNAERVKQKAAEQTAQSDFAVLEQLAAQGRVDITEVQNIQTRLQNGENPAVVARDVARLVQTAGKRQAPGIAREEPTTLPVGGAAPAGAPKAKRGRPAKLTEEEKQQRAEADAAWTENFLAREKLLEEADAVAKESEKVFDELNRLPPSEQRDSPLVQKRAELDAQHDRLLAQVDALDAERQKLPSAPDTEAPKAKRGRPTVLTSEEKQQRAEAKKPVQAQKMKADRAITRLTKTLDELAQPFDDSEFDTDEEANAARDERASQKRKTIQELLRMQADPALRGTKVAERIKAALEHPSISAKERADLKAGLDAMRAREEGVSRSAVSKGKPDTAFNKFTTGAQALSHIIKTGNEFQKMLGKRLRAFMGGVRFVVIEEGQELPAQLKTARNARSWERSIALYIENYKTGDRVVYVRGASFGNDQGINNVTILHELLHAATNRKIMLAIDAIQRGADLNSQLVRSAQALLRTMNSAIQTYNDMARTGKLSPELVALARSGEALTDPREFIAYGMTDDAFQKFLMNTHGYEEDTSFFTRFVNGIRELFGMDEDTTNALTDLIVVTDSILSSRAPRVEIAGEVVSKATEPNKTVVEWAKEFFGGRKASDGSLASDNFVRWFGNSKVVDEKGSPLRVYHGTEKVFEAFDPARVGETTDFGYYGSGFYFTPNTYTAGAYASDGTGANIMPVYLSIQNPYIWPEYRKVADTKEEAEAIRAELEGQGYDGIIIPYEQGKIAGSEFVVFRPEQIKSATGNVGTFSVEEESVSASAKLDPATRTQKQIERDFQIANEKFNQSLSGEQYAKGISAIQMMQNPKQVATWLRGNWDGFKQSAKGAMLRMAPTDFLADTFSDAVPELVNTDKLMQKMQGMTLNLLKSAGKLTSEVDRAYRKDPALREKLDRITHVSTLMEVDPSDPNAKERSARLDKLWQELGADGQRMYKRIKDHFEVLSDYFTQLLDEQITQSGLPIAERSNLLAKVRALYETGSKITPFFPLVRRGDFWLSIGTGKTRKFFMFETLAERDAAMQGFADERVKQKPGESDKAFEKRRAENLQDLLESEEYTFGNDIGTLRRMSSDSSEMLKGVFQAIDSADLGEQDAKDELKDAVYQIYLQTMPEQSFRRQFIHRKGVTGFRTDVLRNTADATSRMAVQLARIKYGRLLRNSLSQARDSIVNRPEYDQVVATFERRVREELNPRPESLADKIAGGLNKAAFIWYLGGASSALLQPLSLFQTGMPVLSKYGFTNATAEMGRMLKVWDQFGLYEKNADGTTSFMMPTVEHAKGLTDEERRAVRAMLDFNLTTSTYAHNVFDYKNTPSGNYSHPITQFGKDTVDTLVLGGLMHSTERISREMMFLASFRLNRKAGKSFDEAVDNAVVDTKEALGNYGEYNRPEFMRGAAGKVLTQFMMYPVHVTLFLGRNFAEMIKPMGGRTRQEARRKFFGTLGTTFILAGAVGLPMFSTIMGLLGWMWEQFKEDDDPEDLKSMSFELWFRTVWLQEMLGETKIAGKSLADIVERGIANAITGLDVSGRTSLNNLWMRDSKETATVRDSAAAMALEKAGPAANMVLSWAEAYEAFMLGDYSKGVKKALPAGFRNFVTAHEYWTKGAKDNKGAKVLSKDAFTTGELIGQAVGFRSDLLANTQYVTFKAIGLEQKINNERTKILNQLDREFRNRNMKKFAEYLKDRNEFNRKYPAYAIDDEALAGSLERKGEQRAESYRGVTLTDKNIGVFGRALTPSRRAATEKERKGRGE